MSGGFGNGPFGREPFGEWGWERNVLHDSIPTLYREADTEQGELLEKYAEGQFYSFGKQRRLIRDYGDLRDPFVVRSEYTEAEFIVLGKEVPLVGEIEQAGNMGAVVTFGIFKSSDRTARFSESDIGKKLFIRRSNVTANNQQTFSIVSIVSTTELATDPYISFDTGPMRWEIRTPAELPEGQFEVEIRGGDPSKLNYGWVLEDGSKQYPVVSRQMYWQPVTTSRLLNEREASDGQLLAVTTQGVQVTALYSPGYAFQQTDVGKLVFVSAESSDGLTEIIAVEPYGPGGANIAVFGRTSIPGPTVRGKTYYAYVPTADRKVTVEHVAEPLGNLPLEISYRTPTQTRLDITVRLGTNVSGSPSSTPTQIGAALAADPVLSKYVVAGKASTASALPAGVFPRTPLKGRPIAPQSTDVFWSLRPFARLVGSGPLPLGVVDYEGYDLTVLSSLATQSVIKTANSTPFLPDDVGKLIAIQGSPSNDGSYEIVSYVSSDEVRVTGRLVFDASPRCWSRRTAPINLVAPTRVNPQRNEVIAHSQALLDRLAYDFGIRVDTQQVEERQRAWVRQLPNWIASKGTAQSIIDVAHLSGFQCEVVSLFSLPVTFSVASGVNLYFLPDEFHSTGSVSLAGVEYRYSDPTFTFTAADVGKVICIVGAANPANNNYFAVASYVDPNTVVIVQTSIGGTLAPVTLLVVPDGNNGSLVGTLGSVFSDTPFALPKYDDVNYDQLAVACDICGLAASERPGIDVPALNYNIVIGSSLIDLSAVSTYPSTNPLLTTRITSVTSAAQTHTVFVKGDDRAMIQGGNWRMEDSAGNYYYFTATGIILASEQVLAGPATPVAYTDVYGNPQTTDTYPDDIWQLTVVAAVPPVVGPVAWTYIPDVIYDCNNCPTFRIAIELTADKVLSEGDLANSNAYERCITLLQTTIPAHVSAIYRLIVPTQTAPLLSGVTTTVTVS